MLSQFLSKNFTHDENKLPNSAQQFLRYKIFTQSKVSNRQYFYNLCKSISYLFLILHLGVHLLVCLQTMYEMWIIKIAVYFDTMLSKRYDRVKISKIRRYLIKLTVLVIQSFLNSS